MINSASTGTYSPRSRCQIDTDDTGNDQGVPLLASKAARQRAVDMVPLRARQGLNATSSQKASALWKTSGVSTVLTSTAPM